MNSGGEIGVIGGDEDEAGLYRTLTAGFLVRVPLSFLSPPAILSPRVAWRFWWWTFLRKRPRRSVVVREAYLRAILLLLLVFLVVVVGLKEVKTSDVGILIGLERLLWWMVCLWLISIGIWDMGRDMVVVGKTGRCLYTRVA